MEIVTEKKCNKCEEVKPLFEFYKKRNECVECEKKRRRNRYDGNLEKSKEYSKEYYSRNTEKVKASQEKYRFENYGKIKARVATRVKENPIANKTDPIVAKIRRDKFHLNNPGKYAEYRSNYRSRINKNGGKHTTKEWKDLCDKYGNRCLCCGRSDVKLTIDHVVPISKGGGNSISNLQPLCSLCNNRKHTEIIDYRF